MSDAPQLHIIGVTASTDDRGRLHLWGEVINLGELTARWVRVTARLKSDRGQTLAEESDIAGLEWTYPGMRNPFYLRFLTPPAGWRTYELQVGGTAHDFDDPSLPQPHASLRAEKLHYREIGRADLRCTVIGLLANRGLAPASHVKAAATLYSTDDHVVGVLSPYLVPRGVLAPGETSIFELKFYALGGLVSHFAVQVQGRMATV